MIIFPQALVLAAAAAGVPLINARIGWQNYLRDLLAADVTVSGETTDGPRDAPLRPDTAEYWQAPALPAWIKVDLGTSRSISYGGVIGALQGCAVKMETSTNNVDWTTFASEILPPDDKPVMFLSDTVEGTVARWIRWSFTGATPPRVEVLMAGAVLAMQRAVSGGYRPINLSRDTVLYRGLSRGGQFLGQGIRRNGLVGSIAFQNLTADWVRSSFDPFQKSARQFPYLLAWNPLQFPLEVAYCWSEDDIVPEYMNVIDLMQVNWKMRARGQERI